VILPTCDFRMPYLYHCHVTLSRENRKGKVEISPKSTFAAPEVSPRAHGAYSSPAAARRTAPETPPITSPKRMSRHMVTAFLCLCSCDRPPPFEKLFPPRSESGFSGASFPGPSRRVFSTVRQGLRFHAHEGNEKEWKNPLPIPDPRPLD